MRSHAFYGISIRHTTSLAYHQVVGKQLLHHISQVKLQLKRDFNGGCLY